MHELGVVFHIIDQVEEVAAENDVTRIDSVTLQLGEVSTVIPSYLTDCWDWAKKKHELLLEAKLVVEKIEAVTFCEDCKQTYPTVEYGKTCPHCGSGNTYLVQGNEFMIKEIEAV
ncbi:MAG: hydrogenase maturation nickel metallochaperone HypA [Lachnospiraceae bacterium]|nr:hydrogenase maturation nickel metallochaperone HypA [Lachnospiraceae bacterium]